MKSGMVLRDIALNVILGWPESERAHPQTIYLALKLDFTQPPSACANDQLANTVCYDQLIQTVQTFCTDKTFKLIENLAYEIYQIIQAIIPETAALSIKITKQPPITALQGGVDFYYGACGAVW